jgi:hypothetical protein
MKNPLRLAKKRFREVGDEPRKLIAIRLNAKVLGWLCKTAEKKAALSITRERDFGQRDTKGELELSER